MPFFDQAARPAMPSRPPYQSELVQRWTAAIVRSDGFVFVTPEYNYGASAVLKNATDWVYPEWNRKAAGFVSYGGPWARAASSSSVKPRSNFSSPPFARRSTSPLPRFGLTTPGGDVDAGLAELSTPAAVMIDDLLSWTTALKTARTSA
jgi:hypothetical protein